ncbi:SLC26A/SULP TRANSPORTER-RELATED [Salix viminalis]|uniref:SLC26A/SULP TRANSPORTER-RELATED n=1 Tax=Salix viminalis TaxID=40686 RepID=A0A9Q0UU97_SALVM|nr:SLC26A/SULP TRANSPORTER-RELATED [Salix viminalis]
MGSADYVYPATNVECSHRVAIPPPQPFVKSLKYNLKETFFPDDPLRQFKNQPTSRRFVLGLKYFFPIFDWAPSYTFDFLKSDFIAGITIASLAIPQGISYAKLANLPPILGLYSSFIPPLVYAMMGSSRDLAVGTVAVASLLTASMLGNEVNANENPKLYLHLAFTATFFAGAFQASLGLLRLGFIVDFLSHATIIGFMAGAATVVILQQLKGILGLEHFTHSTDLVSVMRSVFSQTHQWRWESAALGFSFLFFLLVTRYFSKRKPKFFWVSAMAPLTSVILGSLLVYLTHAEKHGVQVIGYLKKGLNPPSFEDLVLVSPYLSTAIKTGIITGVIALAEGIAVGRSFAMFKNYHIDGNKEMIAFGTMNIVGSCTSCYLTTGPFSRSAVNFNAGCKTAVSNIVMALAVMVTLLFLTPLFHYTPLVVLSSIIIGAMLGLIDYEAAIHLWTVDKFDFIVCMSAYAGVVFGSVEIGLVVAVAISLLRVLLFVARPKTFILGNIPDTMIYRNVEQYTNSNTVPGVLILEIDAPIYFANASYLRERIARWVDEEEDRLKTSGETSLQYVILDMGAVGNIDTSGISMLEEVKKVMDRRELKLVLANPGAEVMKKLNKSKLIDKIGQEWIYLTVGEAVGACNFLLHTCKPDPLKEESEAHNKV